jgi:hypothetical protein
MLTRVPDSSKQARGCCRLKAVSSSMKIIEIFDIILRISTSKNQLINKTFNHKGFGSFYTIWGEDQGQHLSYLIFDQTIPRLLFVFIQIIICLSVNNNMYNNCTIITGYTGELHTRSAEGGVVSSQLHRGCK